MDNAEPIRYRVADIQTQMTLGCGNGGILVTDPNGPIVAYGEYARLKAENERLRKAGDAMAQRLNIGFTEVPWKYGPKWYAWHTKAETSVNDWNASKEENKS